MKKIALVFASVIIIAGMFTISSCTKTDDTGAPVITLKTDDAAHNRVAQNSAATYTDPGYTVTDDVDKVEDITVVVTGTVNMASAGDYILTYTATDKAGNKAEKTRTVTVDGALYINGGFTVEDFTGSTSNGTYPETLSSSTINYNKISFTKFAFYTNGTVYGTISGNTITIPSQTVTCGSPAADRNFTGSGTYTNPNTFTINYTEVTNGTTVTGHGAYTRN